MRVLILGFMLLLNLALSACAGMNSRMDCPMKAGVHCESLDQVNAQVDQGTLGYADLKEVKLALPIKNTRQQFVYPYRNQPLRYGETVMRVWIAPFEDTAGNYHQESEVYAVVKPSHWIGNPKKAMDSDED